MALSNNKAHRILLFSSVYLVQGCIRGFATVALAAYLIERGMSDINVGFLTGLTFLPWSFKIIWGPVVDYLGKNPAFQRVNLIIFAQIGIACGLALLSWMGNPLESVVLTAALLFTISVFVSLQDVTADALAIRTVPLRELGLTNGAMQCGRMGGAAIGTSVSAISLVTAGFTTTVLWLFLMTCVMLLIPVFISEQKNGVEIHAIENTPAPVRETSGLLTIILSTIRSLASRNVSLICAFGLVASIGDSMLGFINKPFYIRRLGWTAAEFSYTSSWGFAGQAAGALVAGLLFLKFRGIHRIAALAFLASASLAVVTGIAASSESMIPTLHLVVGPAITTIGWVGFLALAMQVSRTAFAATMFATIVTLCNVGTVCGVALASPLHDQFDVEYSTTMIIGGLTVIVASGALANCRSSRNDE